MAPGEEKRVVVAHVKDGWTLLQRPKEGKIFAMKVRYKKGVVKLKEYVRDIMLKQQCPVMRKE